MFCWCGLSQGGTFSRQQSGAKIPFEYCSVWTLGRTTATTCIARTYTRKLMLSPTHQFHGGASGGLLGYTAQYSNGAKRWHNCARRWQTCARRRRTCLARRRTSHSCRPSVPVPGYIKHLRHDYFDYKDTFWKTKL